MKRNFEINRSDFRKILTVFCLIVMIGLFGIPAAAAENDSGDQVLGTKTEYNGETFRFTFPYNDAWFTDSDTEYHQGLSRASVGLAIASVRDLSNADNEGDLIEQYLLDAGFMDVDTSSYLKPTETDSIACGLGHKKIGDATLVVVGVCSANYQKEWAGNLRVGDETDHAGFRIAADKLKKYLKDYEEQHGISGKKILWVTGFSRGGAVGNLFAGDMMRAGEYEKLFGYFFATPRNTKEPLHCDNIMNIISKDDFIPMFPFAEFGYERNGRDLYIFSPASDTDIGEQVEAMDDSCMKTAGQYYYSSQAIVFFFRTIANYFLDICSTSAEYKETLQDLMVRTFADGISEDFIDDLSEALSQLTFKDPKKEQALQGIIEYIRYFVNDFIYRGYPEENGHLGWDSSIPFFENIKREHSLLRYASWVFADIAPEQFFSKNMTFTKVIISTDADLEVYDEYGMFESFEEQMTYHLSPDRPLKNHSYVDIFRNGKQLILIIPNNKELRLVLKPKHREVAKLFTLECSYKQVRYSNECMGFINLNASPCTLIFGPDGEGGLSIENESGFNVAPISTDKMLSTYDLVAIENDSVETVSLLDLGIILGSLLLFILLGIIISIILAVTGKRNGGAKKVRNMVIGHGIFAVLFTVYGLLVWRYYPGIYIICSAMTFLLGVDISLLALRGFLMNKNKTALVLLIVSILFGALITMAGNLYIPFNVPYAILFVAGTAAVFTVVCFWCVFSRK